jgi:hypothetical protein
MIVPPNVLDDVLKAIFLGDADSQDTIRQRLNLPLDKVLAALLILKQDGYIDSIIPEGSNVYLRVWALPSALTFINGGGYSEAERIKRLNEQQIQSVIDTNASVKKTNAIQKWALFLATMLSVASVLISYLAYKKNEVINVPPPRVIIQQLPPTSPIDTASQKPKN